VLAAGADAVAIADSVEEEALRLAEEDLAMNRAIGAHGAELLPPGTGVLTYCNTGGLATGGYGTALGVIRTAWRQGRLARIYVAETRPVLQGARLTAWELLREGIPVILCTDAAAGALMRRGEVDAVVVGADRIAANGDVANKVGTYTLAVLARAHGIPFYVAAPRTSVDLETPSGDAIPLEERPPEEITRIQGVPVAPEGVAVRNPAFDVTPAEWISAIVTDAGVARPPLHESLRRLLGA
jgi:methylthioribose-1-phosphate isomerase